MNSGSFSRESKDAVSMSASTAVAEHFEIEGEQVGTVYLNSANKQYFFRVCGRRFAELLQRCGIDVSGSEAAGYVQEFLEDEYRGFPASLKDARGSVTFGGLLTLWVIGRAVKPDRVIESGVFKGASLWLWRALDDNIAVEGYDINIGNCKVVPEGVHLHEGDWTWFDESFVAPDQVCLAFFDDHIDCAKRLLECKRRGVEWVVFDDAPSASNLFKYRYPAVPSVAMIMDEDLQGGEVFEWFHSGTERTLRYVHEIAQAREAKSLIAAAVPLTATDEVFGLRAGDKWLVKIKK